MCCGGEKTSTRKSHPNQARTKNVTTRAVTVTRCTLSVFLAQSDSVVAVITRSLCHFHNRDDILQ